MYTPLSHTSVFSLLLVPYPLLGRALTFPIHITAGKRLPHQHPAPSTGPALLLCKPPTNDASLPPPCLLTLGGSYQLIKPDQGLPEGSTMADSTSTVPSAQ